MTGIATDEGWLSLAAVMDLASRHIAGWPTSEWVKADLVCKALKSAYSPRKPTPGLIIHCDRGGQYASTSCRALVGDYRIRAWMSGKADRGTTRRWRAAPGR